MNHLKQYPNTPPLFLVEWVPIRFLKPFPKAIFAVQVDVAEPKAYLAQAGGAKKHVAIVTRDAISGCWSFYHKVTGEWQWAGSTPKLADTQRMVYEQIAALV